MGVEDFTDLLKLGMKKIKIRTQIKQASLPIPESEASSYWIAGVCWTTGCVQVLDDLLQVL